MKSRILKRVERLEHGISANANSRNLPTPERQEQPLDKFERYCAWRQFADDARYDWMIKWFAAYPDDVNLPDDECVPFRLLRDRVPRTAWWAQNYPGEPYPATWIADKLKSWPGILVFRRGAWRRFRELDMPRRKTLWDMNRPGEALPQRWITRNVTARQWWKLSYPGEGYPPDWVKMDVQEKLDDASGLTTADRNHRDQEAVKHIFPGKCWVVTQDRLHLVGDPP